MEAGGEPNFVFPFEKLEVWQLAVDLADFVLHLLESVPPNKYVRLIGQADERCAKRSFRRAWPPFLSFQGRLGGQPPGLVFSTTYLWGSFAPSDVPLA
jgi:hypothetical protein